MIDKEFKQPKTSPLVVILGPTASGKTALSMEVAKRFNGEIICADSRTIYKQMDIGTAKPTKEEQAAVRHHGLDIISPDKAYSAAQFQELALKAIKDITNNGKLPIMVGGSGLYIDSVIYNFKFSKPGAERDPLNPRHLIETKKFANKLRNNTLIIGVNIPRPVLKKRIQRRILSMVKLGLEEEVRTLVDKFGWQEALTGVGYREFREYFSGNQSFDRTIELIAKDTVDYAKRQCTWFKRNKSIQWVSNKSEAVAIVTTYMNK